MIVVCREVMHKGSGKSMTSIAFLSLGGAQPYQASSEVSFSCVEANSSQQSMEPKF